ncbi:hypothetical protein HMPREF1624_07487 [Sporothrix schenckii ATCC 58251]|uniref:6-phosphogluconate dehydrogenase NADP-binding domain-containing protein n=1 Tax=Sporothrix schenckii (strain ATCC 58251 / de Perez 2211183) TaxID=1391915 RepID=U7PK75_SPOS1|nr:hypothetical protein HMPREF1624_07487 [Sporothrix schenckii ATCC 58251]
MAPSVFFVGLGNMGSAMCKNVVQKANLDKPLIVYNRSKDRSTALVEELAAPGKVTIADSVVAGAKEADIVWTMLSADAIVESVYDEVLSSDANIEGKLFIQSATIHPDTTERLAAKVEKRGALFLAAPVFGAPAMAEAGALVGVLSGAAAAVDRAQFLFKGVTSRQDILLKDAPVSHAALLKVIGNTFILNMVEQLAEGHVLAEKTGLGTGAMHELMQAIFPGSYVAYSERMMSGQYYTMERPLFAVDLARKDIGFALRLGEKVGVTLQNARTADAHLVEVKAHDGETGDVAGIYGAVRQESGLPYENLK